MEEQQQQQEQEYDNYVPMSGKYQQETNKADILDKIRPEDTVEEIKHFLMGEDFSKEKGVWVTNPALKEMALTEIGACSVAVLIYPTCSRTSSLSNLDEKLIWNRWKEIVITLQKNILDNWSSWGIKTTAQIYWLSSIVRSAVLVSLKQPENEGIRRMLNSTIQESRNVSTYNEDKGGGILGMFRRK